MRAMHAICRYNKGKPDHLHSAGELGCYRSGIWKLAADDALSLEGGWLYLHETSKKPAYFRARIEGVEGPDADGKYWLIVRKHLPTGNVAWRGMVANSSSYIRVVPADLPEELEGAAL